MTQNEAIKAEARILAFLSDGEWRTWKEIEEATGVGRQAARQLTIYCDGTLIPSSTLGMKLNAFATDVERWHATNTMRSRAREILNRSILIENGGPRCQTAA